MRGLLSIGWAPHPRPLLCVFSLDLLVFGLRIKSNGWMIWAVVLGHGIRTKYGVSHLYKVLGGGSLIQ